MVVETVDVIFSRSDNMGPVSSAVLCLCQNSEGISLAGLDGTTWATEIAMAGCINQLKWSTVMWSFEFKLSTSKVKHKHISALFSKKQHLAL